MSTARAVRRAYDRCLAEVGVNLTQVQLARRIGTSRARVGVHIDSLQVKGAVDRRAIPPTDESELTGDGNDVAVRELIAEIGFIRSGSVAPRLNYCGKPGCRCHADPPPAARALLAVDREGRRQDRVELGVVHGDR